jgi:hypothetical protein
MPGQPESLLTTMNSKENSTMTKFLRHKTYDEIRQQCAAAGIELDTSKYDEGSDYIVVSSTGPNGEKARVLYSTVNGNFFGTTPDGTEFSSDDKRLDGTPWFDALLNFFLVAWTRDDEVTSDLLRLATIEAPVALVATWTDEQVKQADEWTGAVHLRASDNDNVIVPPRPAFLEALDADDFLEIAEAK